MSRIFPALIFALLAAGALRAQASAPLVFEAASVKVNQTGDESTHIGHTGGTLTITNATLKYCILRAYGIADAQVSGPTWLDTLRYDIVAKSADDAVQDRHTLRLQALLAERFHLGVHRETREMTVYALTVAKGGPKFAALPGEHTGEGDVASGPGQMTAKAATMDHFASFLAGPRADLRRVVVNQTGLDGAYSFRLAWTPEGARAPGADAPPLLPSALEEQLGLKLETRRAPVEILVIDHADKVPVAN